MIAVSASALRDERDRCLQIGMDDFLSKPFTLDDLRVVLRRWLPAAPEAAPALVAPADSAILDEKTIDGLRGLESRGREGLVEGIIRTWIRNAGEQLDRVPAALESGALDDVRGIAHGIKSASAFVGAFGVRDVALRLEQAAQAGSADCAQLAVELADAFGKVCPLLEAVLGREAA